MTFSQARIDAYAKVEESISELHKIVAKESGDSSDNVIDTWLVLISSIQAFSADDENKPLDDEDMNNVIGFYSKRGSLPMMNQALAQEYLYKCQSMNRDG